MGVLVPMILGWWIPEKVELEKDLESFYIHHFWRIMWVFPIFTGLL